MFDGFNVGYIEGDSVNGVCDGFIDGCIDGISDGFNDGFKDGFKEGFKDGFKDGAWVGFEVSLFVVLFCDFTNINTTLIIIVQLFFACIFCFFSFWLFF